MFGRNYADRRFAHFCRTGDPDALADVFDCTAGRLMRVAMWLAGNRADAEDLLQRTFLQVIETRTQYEVGRPMLPWLLGLLSNQARKLRRERTRAIEPAAKDHIQDPQVEASTHELEHAVSAVRDRLGNPYSEVLRLHLEEGLNGKEIAVRLLRPPGTVRTQLVRALDLLRRQLPGGFVAGLAALTVVDAGALAAVRQTVLAAANEIAPAATAGSVAVGSATVAGVVMAKKMLFVVPLALLLGALAWTALWSSRANDVVLPNPGFASVSDVSAERGPEVSPQVAANTATMATMERSKVALPETSSEPDFAELRVVVRWQHDGTPAVGMGLRARNANGSPLGERYGVTDADGTALLRHLAPATYWVEGSLLDEMDAIAVLAGELRTVEATATAKSQVRGRVVDADGRPVAGARLWLSAQRTWSRGYAIGLSDEYGGFLVPLADDSYLGALKDGHVSSLIRGLEFGRGAPTREVVLSLRGASASIRGTVLDTRGEPVPWARVLVGPPGGGSVESGSPDIRLAQPNPEGFVTDLHGQFFATGVPADAAWVAVWAEGFGPHQERIAATAGQQEEITITLADGAVVQGVVRDASGQPVAKAGIRFGDEWMTFPYSLVRSDAAGRFRIANLPASSVDRMIKLLASNGTMSAEGNLQLTAGATTEWNPVLGHGRTIRGTVLGPDDRPLTSAKVGVVHPNYQHVQRWHATQTDGSFEIQQVGDEPRSVQVSLLDAVLREVRGVAPDTENLLIRLDARDLPTAHLRGRILDARGRPLQGWVFLGRGDVMDNRLRAELDPAGAFTFGPISAARYRIHTTLKIEIDSVDLQPNEDRVLDDIVVRPTGTLELTVTDAAGQPVDSTNVFLTSESGNLRPGGLVARGRGTISELQPGRYLIEVHVNKARSSRAEMMIANVEVQSGVTTPVEIHGRPSVTATITFRDPGPANPERSVQVFFRGEDGQLAAISSTYLRRPLQRKLAPGRYQLDCRVDDGRRVTAELVIRSTDERPQLTIELPER